MKTRKEACNQCGKELETITVETIEDGKVKHVTEQLQGKCMLCRGWVVDDSTELFRLEIDPAQADNYRILSRDFEKTMKDATKHLDYDDWVKMYDAELAQRGLHDFDALQVVTGKITSKG